MASFNRVLLMGNLTRDPVLGEIPTSGKAVCDFGLAVNRHWKDAEGKDQEDVLFIDCTAFGHLADTIGKNLTKGRPIHIEGRLKLDRWEQDGQSRSKIRVIVEQFQFVDSNPANDQPEGQGKRSRNGKTAGRKSLAQPVAAG